MRAVVINSYYVMKFYALHNAENIMIVVLSERNNIEKEVYFGMCIYRNFHCEIIPLKRKIQRVENIILFICYYFVNIQNFFVVKQILRRMSP